MHTDDYKGVNTPRFRVELVDSTGAVQQQHGSNDARQAMESFTRLGKEEFGRELGRGSQLRLVDARGDYDATTRYEGFGSYRTTFATDTGRTLHDGTASIDPLSQSLPARVRQQQVQAEERRNEPDLVPQVTKAAVELASTGNENRIDFVSREQLKTADPAVETLRQEAIQTVSTGTDKRASAPPDAQAAVTTSAAAPTKGPDGQALLRDRDSTLEVIARMNQRELEAYVVARRASPEQAEAVLKRAHDRQVTDEADLPAQRAVPGLEDRFNVVRKLGAYEYQFRDRPGVAFTEHVLSMRTQGESQVVAAAMLDRAQERGWETVKLAGSEEFKRQAWIAAEARGIKSVGYQPTEFDRAEALKQRDRLATVRGEAAPSQNEIHNVTPAAKADSDRQIKAQQRQAELGAVERPSQSALRSYLVSTNQAPPDLEKLVANVGAEFQSKRVHVGQLVDHGHAPYEFKKGSEPNYFVKLQTSAGEQTIWGKDLERAVSNIERGEVIALEHRGKEPVVVQVKERDGAGNVVGRKEIEATRNVWHAQTLDQLRAGPRVDKAASQQQPVTADGQRARPHETAQAAPAQVISPQRQQRPELSPAERKAEDALMREVERAFTARGVPPELRAELRKMALQSFDDRRARGEPVHLLQKKATVRDPSRAQQQPLQPAPKRPQFQQEQSR